ncbi:MAG TPA: serine hydrolase domain-containing protein [Actinomycetes bacterium]|nr:serine hydrolase domain-containing protein [Actinomycetes bacterium]
MAGPGQLAAAAARLEAFARQRLRTPGLVVALVGPGGWRHEFAVGVAEAASGRPLGTDALLPIASIGKAMTAVALLREAQAGRVDLDAAVHQQLPWLPLPAPFGPIRLRHLLAHTAGIVAGLDASPSPVVEALALAGTPPGWPAGERFFYSNVGYGLLGLVLERVAGCSYAEAIQRHVLDPCGMTASEAVTTAEAQARAATGHLELADGGFVPAPWVPTASGAGSTLCTAADLGRFLRALLTGEPPLLDLGYHRLMTTPALGLPEGEGYGYGLGVEVDVEAGYRRVGHAGDCPGFGSYAYGCAETGVGVVALYNGPWRRRRYPASSWPVVDHGLALLRAAALGRELPADPPPAQGEAHDEQPAAGAGRPLPGELAALVGTYAAYNPWVPQVEIRPDGTGGLLLVWPWGDQEPLTELEAGGFRLGDDPASPERVHFRAVVEGRPMQAVVSGWPFDRLSP